MSTPAINRRGGDDGWLQDLDWGGGGQGHIGENGPTGPTPGEEINTAVAGDPTRLQQDHGDDPGERQQADADPWATSGTSSTPWWSSTASWDTPSGGWNSWDWSRTWDNDWWGSSRSKDYSDPPAWPGWGNYRLWRRATQRWNDSTDVAIHRRAERIFKTMDWELQAKFEHYTDQQITGYNYLELILTVMDTLAGEKEASDKRRAVRKALFEGTRRGDESLAQFTLRREQDFAMAEKYMPIPGDLKAFMMEEHAALGRQGTMNLRTLTSGSHDYGTVMKALKILDTEEETITGTGKGKGAHFSDGTEPGGPSLAAVPDEDGTDVSSISPEDEAEILAEIEKMDLPEEEAFEIYAALEHEKRTWKENRKLKMARRKDRRHFHGSGEKGQGGQGLHIDKIKRISRCSNCGEKGHWAEDCRKPYRSKAERLAQEAKRKVERNTHDKGKGSGRATAFVYMGGEDSESTFVAYEEGGEFYSYMAIPEYVMNILQRHRKGHPGKTDSFLTLPAGHAIIDPGAGQDLIGESAFRRLEEKLAEVGLRTVHIDEKPQNASGVGGKATTLFQALVPCILGQQPGIVKLTVVKEDIPHLLSIGLLERAGAVINTKTNEIKFENFDTADHMMRVRSGHRTVDITKWSGGIFPVPSELRQKYGVSKEAFNLASIDEEVYMERAVGMGREGVQDHWEVVPRSSLAFRVHNQPRQLIFQPSREELPQPFVDDSTFTLQCTVMYNQEGKFRCQLGNGHHRPPGELWTGVSIFTFKDLGKPRDPTSATSAREQDGHSADPQFDTLSTRDSHERLGPSYMATPGGEDLQSGDSGGEGPSTSTTGWRDFARRIINRVSASGVSDRRGGEPIREVEEMPGLPHEDRVHAAHSTHGEEEGQQAGRGVCGREGEGQGTSWKEEGIPRGGDGVGGEDAEHGGRPTGDAGPEQPTAAIRSVPHDGPSYGARSPGTADHDGADATAADQPVADDAEHAEQPGADDASGSGIDQPGGPDPEPGLGDTTRLTSHEAFLMEDLEWNQLHVDLQEGDFMAATTPGPKTTTTFTKGFYVRGCMGPNCCRVIQEDGKMRWFDQDYTNYLEDEDINDDYEVGVPTNAKKAVPKVVNKKIEEVRQIHDYEYKVREKKTMKKGYKVMEIFSPPRVTKECERRGIATTSLPAFDIEEGWDYFDYHHRKKMWQVIEEEEPDLIITTPECRAFSQMMNINWKRMDEKTKRKIQAQGLAMLHAAAQVAEYQVEKGRHFLLEQPDGASSWGTSAVQYLRTLPGMVRIKFDQCRFGLNPSGRGLSRKRTAFLLNQPGIQQEFVDKMCDGTHEHVPLEGGSLTHEAQKWPPLLVNAIVRGILKERRYQNSYYEEIENLPAINEETDEEREPEDDEGDEDEHNEGRDRVTEARGLSEEQKKMVHRLHINLGHLPMERLQAMLKVAKARPEVLEYVKKDYQCEQCMQQRREKTRRKAAFPRTFEFNRILGLDTFFIRWQNKSIPFLNVVDHGSNFQMACVVRPCQGDSREPTGGNPTSAETWHHFLSHWVRPHGAPEAVVTDGGMEFRDRLEQMGVLHTVTDQESPWQNGRTERHGSWLKERLEMELSTGSAIVNTLEELEELCIELVACKNCWFNRGGFLPAQIVYGKNPRLPLELLQDANQDSPGWEDALCDASELDTAGAHFRKSHEIRERARKLCMEHARERTREASRPPLHRHRTWGAGQWVLVWRLSKNGPTRHRWVGPGIVILQNGHTVYVAMRSRLWKCNSDQLRPANPTEEMAMEVVNSDQYKELMMQMQKQRQGAVDVTREGTPPREAWSRPEVQVEEQPALTREGTGAREGPATATRGEQEYHPLRPRTGGEGDHDEERHDTGVDGAIPTELRTTRRPSQDTVSEPASEPGAGGSISSEDHEAKRRRTLPTVPEEGLSRIMEGGAESSRDRTNPVTPAIPQGDGRVRAQAREYDRITENNMGQLRMRRRSRSPVPEVIRRQMMREQARDGEPGGQGGTVELDQVDYIEITQDQMKQYKEASHNYAYFQDYHDKPEEFSMIGITGGQEGIEINPIRVGEVTWGQMDEAEKEKFREADHEEWKSLEHEFKAVKVWKGEEAARLRRRYRDRIMTARVVRRRKPVPGLHQFKAKSRFCVHGHKDPDSGTFRTFAPTPSTEALNMVLQVIANLDMLMSFGDVKAAFAQGERLARPRGRLFVEPCEGTPVNKDDLIELIAPVYGLDDAPLRWHETITEFLAQIGFQRALLDPCVFTLHHEGTLQAIVLIEVDDFLIGTANEWAQEQLHYKLQSRFKFGKFERQEADFIGRHIRRNEHYIALDQEKYITEKIHPLEMSRGRRSRKEDVLTSEEFKSYRSMLYRVSWVAHQTRPEVAGTVSILASRMHQATVQDMILLNKATGHLRSTAQQSLKIRKLDPDKMTYIGISDAGGVDGEVRGNDEQGMIQDPVQGAWMVCASDMMPSHDRKIAVTILSWRSSKLKRRVTSTMASETLSLSQCLGELEWLQIFYRDLVYKDVDTNDWHRSLSPFVAMLPEKCRLNSRQEQCVVTDAKSLYDALYKQCPASRQDRRNALELALVIDVMKKTKSEVRWTPHQRMVVDVLTKADVTTSNGALLHLIRGGQLRIDKEEEELYRRQMDKTARSRTRRASDQLLQAEDEEYEMLVLLSEIIFDQQKVGGAVKLFHRPSI